MEIQEDKYNELLGEVATLRKENEEMKVLLFAHGLAYKHGVKENKGSIVSLYSPVVFSAVTLGEKKRIVYILNEILISLV